MMNLNQKGQATLEYIMLFVVTIFIAGGLYYQFNDAFKNFVNNYFGAYVACLLESGELPSLGWDAQNSGDDSCEDEFEPFNLATGRRPISGGWESPRYVGKTSPETPPYSGENTQSSSSEEKSSSASGPKAELAMAQTRNIPAGESSGAGLQMETIGDREAKSKSVPLSRSDTTEAGQSGSGGTGGATGGIAQLKGDNGRPEYVPVSGLESEDAEKSKKKNIPATEIDIQRDVKRIPAEQLKKKKQKTEEEADLNFSDFIKYLMIFGIIVAMAIFLGGQALQISKSQEK